MYTVSTQFLSKITCSLWHHHSAYLCVHRCLCCAVFRSDSDISTFNPQGTSWFLQANLSLSLPGSLWCSVSFRDCCLIKTKAKQRYTQVWDCPESRLASQPTFSVGALPAWGLGRGSAEASVSGHWVIVWQSESCICSGAPCLSEWIYELSSSHQAERPTLGVPEHHVRVHTAAPKGRRSLNRRGLSSGLVITVTVHSFTLPQTN